MLYVCICAIYIESERTELLFPFLSLNPFGIFKNDCKAIRRKWKKKKTKPEKKIKKRRSLSPLQYLSFNYSERIFLPYPISARYSFTLSPPSR